MMCYGTRCSLKYYMQQFYQRHWLQLLEIKGVVTKVLELIVFTRYLLDEFWCCWFCILCLQLNTPDVSCTIYTYEKVSSSMNQWATLCVVISEIIQQRAVDPAL